MDCPNHSVDGTDFGPRMNCGLQSTVPTGLRFTDNGTILALEGLPG
jgi:hypothetical protein